MDKSAKLAPVPIRALLFRHGVEAKDIHAIITFALASKRWHFPPVLVHEVAARFRLLDGHHRARAAQIVAETTPSFLTIPAWVISEDDYNALLSDAFHGEEPDRISSVRQLIDCGGVDGDSIASRWHKSRKARAGAGRSTFSFPKASLHEIEDRVRELPFSWLENVDARVPQAAHPYVRYSSRLSRTTCSVQ